MKKTDKTALTAAAFAAALNIVPMGAAAFDPAEEPIQDVYGPPVYYETTETPPEMTNEPYYPVTTFEPVYGPPEVMYSMYPWLTSTTSTTFDNKPQPDYGPPEMWTTENTALTKDPVVTTTEEYFAPVYGPEPPYGDLNFDYRVDSFDLIKMRQLYVKQMNGEAVYYSNVDANYDNKFTLADLVVLNRYLLGRIKGIGANYDPNEDVKLPDDTVETTRTQFTAVYGPPSWFEKQTTTTVADDKDVTTTTQEEFSTVYGPPSWFGEDDK